MFYTSNLKQWNSSLHCNQICGRAADINYSMIFFMTVITTNAWKRLKGPDNITTDSVRNDTIASCCALSHSASNLSWSRWYCSWKTQADKHTHTTKIKINEDCDSLFGAMHFCVGEKDSSPVGGAPVLPATSPDAFDPPHGPTTSGMRRGWEMAPGAGDAQTSAQCNTPLLEHANKDPVRKWKLTSDIADSEPPVWKQNNRLAERMTHSSS